MIIKETPRYRLVETKAIELVGNYQILDLNEDDEERSMPKIFDDLEDALKKFEKLTQEVAA